MNDTYKTKAQLIAELKDFREKHEKCENRLKIITKEQSLLQDLIDKNPLSIQIVDKDGYTVLANPAHGKLFKAKPKKDFSVFKDHQLIEQGLNEYFKRLKNGEEVDFPDTTYNAHLLDPTFTDNPVNIKVLGFPIIEQENKAKRYVIIHEDITGRKKMEKDLEDKNTQLKEKEEFIENLRKLERDSIRRDIHDELAQSLTTIKMLTGSIWKQEGDEILKKKLKNVFDLTDRTIIRVKNILEGLAEDSLENENIIPAIIKYCREISFMGALSISKNLPKKLELSKGYNYLLFHIVKEALLNVLRHAQANNISLTLTEQDNMLCLMLYDDGIGISDEAIHSEHSSGLKSMRQRTDLMGGSFAITGIKNQGTEIEVRIPLKK
jgi:signal transduction histidine kinase